MPPTLTRALLTMVGALGFAAGLALGLAGCSEEAAAPAEDEAAAAAAAARPTRREGPPSIVLVVVESLRTDAVDGYGPDAASPLPRDLAPATPNLDALIARGLRYDQAIAASPSTVTSHASMFTGLAADQHGADLWTSVRADPALDTIAESLAAAGYETVGFSENPMAGPDFGLDQGFERFAAPGADAVARRLERGEDPVGGFQTLARIRTWLAERDPSRPFFLFVNLADAHLPFPRTLEARFTPKDLPDWAIDRALSKGSHRHQIGHELPDADSLRVLAAAYRQSVAEADRKLGVLTRLLAAHDDPITIVTADHGTHLGERALLGHEFSVDQRVLRVPLVVAGVPETIPGSTHARFVAQWRLADSIRCWAGLGSACARALPGAGAPTPGDVGDGDGDEGGPIVSIAGNEPTRAPAAAVFDTGFSDGRTRYSVALCDEDEGFQSRIVSYIDPPLKYVWRRHAPASLHDLSWDAAERFDQIERRPEVAGALQAEVEAWVAARRLDRTRRTPPIEEPLRDRVEAVFEEGLAAMVADEAVMTDVVWFARLILEDHPDPRLQAWFEAQKLRHADQLYYPIVDPTVLSPTPSPEVLPRGLARFGMYLHAAVAGPDEIALPHLREFLALEGTSGYVLTHQLSGLEWARALGRPLTAETYAKSAGFVERIRAEHATDPRFRDLWAERAAFVALFGPATADELQSWSRTIVDHHLGDGDWGHGGAVLEFDGERQVGEQPRAHLRGLSMVVLARYLANRPTG